MPARLLPPLSLLAANAYITLRLFQTAYTREMGSIEAAYISLAHYIVAHFPDLQWFPLWYGGIPYADSYPPLSHFAVAALAAAGHLPAGLAYHAVCAAVFALMPAALYWTACQLSASRLAAFAAALLYSILTPSSWLVPSIRNDTGGWFGPHRLIVLVHWGEGPHLASILCLTLAIGLVHRALERHTPLRFVLGGAAVAAAVLSNWIGAFALLLAMSSYLLAGFGPARWLRAGAIGAYAYALAVPWVSPGTVATIRANAPLVGGKFETGPIHFAVAVTCFAAILLLAWALKRLPMDPAVRFGVLFFFGTAVITLAGCWFHFRLLPQPERYHLEMDLAFWLLAAVAAAPLTSRIRGARTRAIAAGTLVLVCLPVILHQRNRGHELEAPIDIRPTAEYRISRWLGSHLPGRRVFAPGTIAFWMDAFSDTPLLDGGFDNGMRNTLLQDVNFQILYGAKLETALEWLRAYGCEAIVGGDPESTEVYHPYAHPGKLHGLPELWRDGPEVIYEVPARRRSLAYAVHLSDLPLKRPPGYDASSLKPYLAALDDPALPDASFVWKGTGAAEIRADLRPDHLLSVQVTWDQGWRASINGQPRRVWGDKLGQLVVEPRCNGRCTVELVYDGGVEGRLARWISRAAAAGGLLWVLIAPIAWQKRSASARTN